jgi:Cu+-exporting ATPase
VSVHDEPMGGLALADTAIRLVRRTLRTIRTNLAWSFGCNLLPIPLAALGLLNPLIAGGAMTISSAFIVWNSAGLRDGSPARRQLPAPRPTPAPRQEPAGVQAAPAQVTGG